MTIIHQSREKSSQQSGDKVVRWGRRRLREVENNSSNLAIREQETGCWIFLNSIEVVTKMQVIRISSMFPLTGIGLQIKSQEFSLSHLYRWGQIWTIDCFVSEDIRLKSIVNLTRCFPRTTHHQSKIKAVSGWSTTMIRIRHPPLWIPLFVSLLFHQHSQEKSISTQWIILLTLTIAMRMFSEPVRGFHDSTRQRPSKSITDS